MLRIHFTAADLAGTRVAANPDALWELSLSMHVLRLKASDPMLAQWKNTMVQRLRPGTALRGQVALPLALNPPLGYFPDFLTPAEATGGFDAGLDAVLATPKRRLRHEVSGLAVPGRSLMPHIADVAAGKLAALNDLGSAIRRFHEVAILPIWERVVAAFDADRALRARALLDGGTATMLNELHSSISYTDGVLEVPSYTSSRDLHLNGRGLLLVPSYFKRNDKPLVLADPQLTPVLVYPLNRMARMATEASKAHLSALIGRSRAAVLELSADGGTTSTIARRSGISLPAASKHLAVLRGTGLIQSTRDGNNVYHTLTALGRALIVGGK